MWKQPNLNQLNPIKISAITSVAPGEKHPEANYSATRDLEYSISRTPRFQCRPIDGLQKGGCIFCFNHINPPETLLKR